MILQIFSIFLTFANVIECFDNGYKLVGTHMIYRHGDRSPAFTYPNSPVSVSFWPNGYGQLTSKGKVEHIRLGQYFRQRYSQLLNSTYIASELFVRSSDYDRTLMSAYCNLIGLYPTSKEKLDEIMSQLETDDQWPQLLPWQPIPVHTAPQSTDYLMGVSTCPYFFELVEQISMGDQIQNISRNLRNFFNELEIWTGSKIINLFDAWILADIILIEALYNVSASWVNTSVIDQLEQIVDLSFYYLFESPETNRIIGGALLNDILDNIRNLMTNNSNSWKAKMYSGHDASIVAILAFLGVNFIHHPPYCSTLFFDLYHMPENNSYALKIEYLNSTSNYTTYAIELPPCSNVICPIDILSPWLDKRLPSKDMTMECRSRLPYPSMGQRIYNNNYQLPVFSVLLFLVSYYNLQWH